jgi:phospholipase/carboxylesterase
MTSDFTTPVAVWAEPDTPLVVQLHGRGSSEADLIGLANHHPAGFA